VRSILACFALLLVACPTRDDGGAKKQAPSSACTSFGQSCEFSPGKLGTCVQKDNCEKDCFVCQSQH
jgi:hypothetical protein